MKLHISSSAPRTLSPFPRRTRPFTEEVASGAEVELGKGVSIPEYIKRVYGVTSPEMISAQLPFLNRDDSDREYQPGVADRFVFSGDESIAEFKKETQKLMEALVLEWKKLGLPTVADEDRQIEVPDTGRLIDSMLAGDKEIIDQYQSNAKDITKIASNVDIMRKANIVRSITPGWWVVSYKGRSARNGSEFSKAIRILITAMMKIRMTSRYQKSYEEVLQTMGDPLDTGVGYPLYTAEVSKDGAPLSKLRVLEMYKDIRRECKTWPDVVSFIMKNTPDATLSKYPFAIAPLRRLQPGYKWTHVFRNTISGMESAYDIQGLPSCRVAWMAPYILNLLISPIQAQWKAFRMCIPGLYHDGTAKRKTLQLLKESSANVIESDFSNYDRTIPNDVMNEFFKAYTTTFCGSDHLYWYGALTQTQRKLPIIWADHIKGYRGNGWVFTPDEIALLSGLKPTAEIGSFMNLLVNIVVMERSLNMSENEIISYLCHNAVADSHEAATPTGLPLSLIQSDDTLCINTDMERLLTFAGGFISVAKDAGIRSKVEPGDKFLMRHMTHGDDTPVIARVWQNTLSNETPYDDALKFIVGLCCRTDGMCGQRTIDAFDLGSTYNVSSVDRRLSVNFLSSLRHFITSASTTLPPATELLDLLIARASMVGPTDTIDSSISALRNKWVAILADRELKRSQSIDDSFFKSSEIAALMRNASIPSQKLLLDQMVALDDRLDAIVTSLGGREHSFYTFAMEKLGQPIQLP